MVLVWPNWFGLDHNDLVTTKMKWSRPKWIGQVKIVIHFGRKSQFGPDQFILVMTISFWSWPNHYGHVQINLVRPKQFCTDLNCFGHIEGQGIHQTITNNISFHFQGKLEKKQEPVFCGFWYIHEQQSWGIKGQYISKSNNLVFSYSKKPMTFFTIFCPSFYKVHKKLSKQNIKAQKY